ncbi:hypothetical protein DSC91_001855 [Paraburkholderia caffeinilytica]|nr:DUF4148 domain-containing protein [Paraburkholderia caffeinilytica]AXL49879.1 hypothetical protein DSC91_001855 [Paraburkholderia caffeinilytica]CAB3786110.1 hypothetical protein LMG28690_02141 [Paraburkholderia caffeinilytica]
MNKSIAIVISMAVLTSSSAFAQGKTRAEVMNELYELEAAGYNPSQGDDGSYPADIQAAQEKVNAKHQAERNAMMNAGQNGQAKPAP